MKNISEFFLALYVRVVTAVRSEKGQTLVEYALLLVLIAIVVIAAITLLGQRTNNVFSNIANRMVQ